VGVLVGVLVPVGVGVLVGVAVDVAVGVGVDVGVSVGSAQTLPEHVPLVQSLPEEQLVPFEQSLLPLPQHVWLTGSQVPEEQSLSLAQLVPFEQSRLPLPQHMLLKGSQVPVSQSALTPQYCPSEHFGQVPPQAESGVPSVAFVQHAPSVPHASLWQSLPEEQLAPFEQSPLPFPQHVP